MSKALLVFSGAYFSSGGIAAVNRLTIRALCELGYSLLILTLNETDGNAEKSVPYPNQTDYRAYHGNKLKFTFATWRSLIGSHYDLILADHVNLASILLPLRMRNKNKYFVWIHGIEVYSPNPTFEGLLGLHFADTLIANSEFTMHSVLQRFPNAKIKTCELALNLTPQQIETRFPERGTNDRLRLQSLSEEEQQIGEHAILHVGRMDPESPHKGQEYLIYAFQTILDRYPDSQLILVGDGKDSDRLKKTAYSLDNRYIRRIFMPGFVDESVLDWLYTTCYVFVMPSRGEGFGLVYLEAMAHRKPCIGGGIDATSCVIQDRVTGFLVEDPRSPQEISEKILDLMADPSRAKEMGDAGYSLVRARYLYPHFLKRFQKIIEV